MTQHANSEGQPRTSADGRPKRATAAAYRGTHINWDRYRDGPDALPHRTVSPEVEPTPLTPAENLAIDVAELLGRVEVDVVRVECRTGGDARRVLFDMRLEYVGDNLNALPWLSLLIKSDAMLAELKRANVPPDSVLLPPWTLPFSRPEVAVSSPCVLVWRAKRSPIDCGRIVADVLLDTLDVSPSRVQVSASECSPLETRRRQDRLSFKRTLQGQTRERRHVQVLNYCVKCGRPLRDPGSARLGIEPECRKSYTLEQLWVAKNRTRDIRFSVKPPSAWAATIADHWKLSNDGDPPSRQEGN